MRLHTLAITAFGPFADTVRVDFDSLFDSSVFLLCGDTGAGKTTVLDAVCFALYGDVPGERGAARQLRSQHAAPGVAPQVVLEVEVAQRRFRFTRSPAWQRPKKRGSGLTTEQARVLLEERVGAPGGSTASTWTTRSTRLDETGHLVADLLGMSLDQFSQVVLLPQGGFDTFLRSSSEDRQRVLTQLFRTRRFEDVERWLVDRRTTLRRACDIHRVGVTALLHRLSESGDMSLPEWEHDRDVDRAVSSGAVTEWVDGLAAVTLSITHDTSQQLTEAEQRLEDALRSHDEGRTLGDLRVQHQTAQRGARRLAQESDRLAADAVRLDGAQRAVAVVPLARAAERAAEQAAHAGARAGRAVAAVTSHLGLGTPILDTDELVDRARLATARAAVARDFVPRARELEVTSAALVECAEVAVQAEARRVALAEAVQRGPIRQAGVAEELDRLQVRAGGLGAAQQRLAELGRLLLQHATATELEFQVADAQRKRDAQRAITLDLREQLQGVRERRLAGMAAELAARMVVGSDCPVCGSDQHPALATAAPGAPTRDDEQVLRERIDDEEIALVAHDDHTHGYRARLSVVRESLAGRTSEGIEADLVVARRHVVDASEASEQEPATRARHDALVSAHVEDVSQLRRVESRLAVLAERRVGLQQQVSRLSGELAAILGRADPDPARSTRAADASVLGLAETDERTAALMMTARDALVEQRRGEDDVALADAAAREAATEHGFADETQAVQAALPARDLSALVEEIARWQRLGEEVEAVLADPAVRAAADGPAPDLAGLAERLDDATRAHNRASSACRLALQQERRVRERTIELAAALADWEPTRVEHERVRSLSELVEGRGSDNTRQMRLSAYVLAARLTQVVAAANERLVRMTDDRFLLEHTADRGVGERRGGLSLLVRDQWTDEVRDPVTLSGGETFVVSLALALGLADVVTGEAGGARIDTLFVDEGFGSLDADTLELVMDTLDTLRDGGRVVGVVSHVAELRTRIPTQLLVRKTRAGSTLEQRLGVG